MHWNPLFDKFAKTRAFIPREMLSPLIKYWGIELFVAVDGVLPQVGA